MLSCNHATIKLFYNGESALMAARAANHLRGPETALWEVKDLFSWENGFLSGEWAAKAKQFDALAKSA
jgi:hypothetical protein